MLEERELPPLQLISRRFYDVLVPMAMTTCSVRSAPHAKKQDCVYQYASGFFMYRTLKDVVQDALHSP